MVKRYEQFPHTADIGVRVYGKDMKELFENAAFAMFDLIADLEGLKGSVIKNFKIDAPNRDELLIAWLDELLFVFYTNEIIFYKFDVEYVNENRIEAKAYGRPVAENRNRLKTEIKAATYSGLDIAEAEDGYKVEIIFDV